MRSARMSGLLAAALAYAWAVLAAGARGEDWAAAMFETPRHDFGSVARGSKAEYEFVLTNIYAADVHIADVHSSCGCTTPSIPKDKDVLKPYEKGAILAHLNSDAYLGQRHATLSVTIDQPQYAVVQLDVAGFVHEDVLFDPEGVDLGSIDRGAGAAGKIIVYRKGRIDWKVLSAKAANPHLSCSIVERARQDNQVWYELDVRLAKDAPCGYIKDYVMLATNDPQMEHVSVTVEGHVLPEVNASPAALFLGVMQPGEKTTRQLVVQSRKPFRVVQVSGDRASFIFPAVSEASARRVQIVPVTFVAGTERGKVVRTIHIQTDLKGASADVSTYAIVNE